MLKSMLRKNKGFVKFVEILKAEMLIHMGKTQNIQAVYDNDLEKFLGSIGLLSDIENELLNCYFCSRIITLENFSACFPAHGIVAACCNDSACMVKILGEKE